MITIPSKVRERLVSGLKKFQPIIAKAKDKDINESDTVTIISDLLSDVFGYDKYTEITSEFSVKKTYCDLAIKLDGQPRMLIEVKAAGLNLKEQHMRQAVDYGANSGIEWIILTNSNIWKVYKIIFSKPVNTELVYEMDLTQLSPKKQADIELLYYLTREAMSKTSKASLDDYLTQKQLLNRFVIGQIILNDLCISAIRKTIKKISADAKISDEEIRQLIAEEIIKRDVLDDEKAKEAKRKVTKALQQTQERKPRTKPDEEKTE